MNATFLDIAAKELDDTFEYYEYQQKNLGLRFILEVENTIERIKYYPKAWHVLSENTRRCLVKNFPYGIIYQERDNDFILIIAVMNLHRQPNYWIDRINQLNK